MPHRAKSLSTELLTAVRVLMLLSFEASTQQSLGLLVAACVNRAPEGLLGAAVAEVGVHDLLKVSSSGYTRLTWH